MIDIKNTLFVRMLFNIKFIKTLFRSHTVDNIYLILG